MRRCILDMDGVLTNFVGGILKAHNIPSSYQDFISTWPEGEYDMCMVLNMLPELFYRPTIQERFWEGLAWMPDGREILQIVESFFGKENIYIWTRPVTPEGNKWGRGCIDGKVAWIEREMPDYLPRFTIGCSKFLAANERTILIDDSVENINEFRKEGGIPIIVPRKWNYHHVIADKNSAYYVKVALHSWRQQWLTL